MLKLSRTQYKQLCADCAAEMMRGAGHGGQIPKFTGTDMKFYVKDNAVLLSYYRRLSLLCSLHIVYGDSGRTT